ncbi:MAG TPA: glycosyltransferase family 4 protein [Rhodothermia bacterium]|nr:glycosyltransferase family 4 protein [Rhodothermia bacterium]
MRVAYVSADPGVPVFGSKGCSVHVQAYLRAFLERGADLTLFSRQIGDEIPPDFQPVRAMRLPRPLVTAAVEREQALLAGDAELTLALEAMGPFDLVYERQALWTQAAMTFADRIGIPGILEVNAPLVDEQEQHRVLLDRQGAERATRAALEAASLIVAVSDQVAARVCSEPHIEAKTIVVPNGVDVDRFKPRARPRESGESFTIGFVGTLKPWHGLDDLLQAFKSIADHDPSVRLLIVGDGPERNRTEQTLDAIGLRSRATLTGSVAHEHVPEWVASMDVAVAPYPSSATCYFSPLKLYEYMACAVPVVASDTGQISDTITNEVDGLLYEPGDANGLARAILAVKESPSLAARLGAAGRECVVSKHTWSASLDRVLASIEWSPQPVTEVR